MKIHMVGGIKKNMMKKEMKYNSNGNKLYYENSDGIWWKKEYDSYSNIIYFESSTGIIYDDRVLPQQ